MNGVPDHVLETHVLPRLRGGNVARFAATSRAARALSDRHLATRRDQLKSAVEEAARRVLVAVASARDNPWVLELVKESVDALPRRLYQVTRSTVRADGVPHYVFEIKQSSGAPFAFSVQGTIRRGTWLDAARAERPFVGYQVTVRFPATQLPTAAFRGLRLGSRRRPASQPSADLSGVFYYGHPLHRPRVERSHGFPKTWLAFADAMAGLRRSRRGGL